jgi:hypothetical protein
MLALEYEIKSRPTIYSPATAPCRDKKLFTLELDSAYPDMSLRR